MTCVAFLEQGCQELGLKLTPQQLADLCRYYQELSKWGKKMNLVAKAGMAETLTSHFLDSLTLLPLLPENEFRMLDVGSGAGFPGLVLKVVCPRLELCIVEPRGKRVAFLRHIVRTLGLERVTVLGERLEHEPEMVQRLGRFDLVTSRAFADMTGFLSLATPYCRSGGQLICMKGPKVDEELLAWQQHEASGAVSLVEKRGVTLPGKDQFRFLVIFGKK
jgi:16S rRNA (guanine527-N7)-methyltransferase